MTLEKISLPSTADFTTVAKQALAAKIACQPWVSENDDRQNFDEAHISLPDVIELSKQFEHKFEPTLQTFIEFLIAGRSFSGKIFDRNAPFYAYLSNAEIEEMANSLHRHYEENFELLDGGAFCKVDFDPRMLEVLESLLLILKQASEFDLFVIAD